MRLTIILIIEVQILIHCIVRTNPKFVQFKFLQTN